MKHILLATGVLATVSLSNASFAARDMMIQFNDEKPPLHGPLESIKNKDYDAFVKAWNENKPTVPTQEQFTKMYTRTQQQQKVEDAIAKNDYTAFVLATTQDSDEKNITQDEFNKIVERHAGKQKIDTAVKNNDYNSFIQAISTIDDDTQDERKKDRPIPTQDEFKKMVEMTTKHDAIQKAILSNNYDTFVQVWEQNKPTVPTYDEFIQITEHKKDFAPDHNE